MNFASVYYRNFKKRPLLDYFLLIIIFIFDVILFRFFFSSKLKKNWLCVYKILAYIVCCPVYQHLCLKWPKSGTFCKLIRTPRDEAINSLGWILAVGAEWKGKQKTFTSLITLSSFDSKEIQIKVIPVSLSSWKEKMTTIFTQRGFSLGS